MTALFLHDRCVYDLYAFKSRHYIIVFKYVLHIVYYIFKITVICCFILPYNVTLCAAYALKLNSYIDITK